MLRGLLNHVATLPLAPLVIGLVICVAVGAVLEGRRLVPAFAKADGCIWLALFSRRRRTSACSSASRS